VLLQEGADGILHLAYLLIGNGTKDKLSFDAELLEPVTVQSGSEQLVILPIPRAYERQVLGRPDTPLQATTTDLLLELVQDLPNPDGSIRLIPSGKGHEGVHVGKLDLYMLQTFAYEHGGLSVGVLAVINPSFTHQEVLAGNQRGVVCYPIARDSEIVAMGKTESGKVKGRTLFAVKLTLDARGRVCTLRYGYVLLNFLMHCVVLDTVFIFHFLVS
jgi:hypothetical protein